MAALGLIDEHEVVVPPRLMGHGPTLFGGLSKRLDLKLVGRLELGSGAVAMRFEPSSQAGCVLSTEPEFGSARAPCETGPPPPCGYGDLWRPHWGGGEAALCLPDRLGCLAQRRANRRSGSPGWAGGIPASVIGFGPVSRSGA